MTTIALDFSTPHVLRTAKEYKAAVAEVDQLLDLNAKKGSPEDDRLEFLTVLIQAYEDEHVPEPRAVTPQEVVDFFLDQHGAKRADLAELMGGRSRVSDFFRGKRELSTAQIRALRAQFGIPADLLLAVDGVPAGGETRATVTLPSGAGYRDPQGRKGLAAKAKTRGRGSG